MIAKTDEPLAISAALARRMAPQLCRKDPSFTNDCSWYHGLWQDLRLLGLAATPEQHADFFRSAFARFAGRPLRLLISGSADYSILAHVLSACSEHQITAIITVVDLCETPLYFNRWYAERAGFNIETIQADIFSYRFAEAFDVICSHGFLSQFSPPQRTEIVRRWASLLAPGGTAISINRIRSGPSGAETRFSEQQGREFVKMVAAKLRQTPVIEESEWSGILARAEIYVRRLSGYSLTEEELNALFQQAGFRIEDRQIISSGAQESKLSGPAIPAHAKHACVIASRI
jgi:2-polyprenyl-3-methyl-5-hydroxy-6-metoxy-1,4-benzoquinol methylase